MRSYEFGTTDGLGGRRQANGAGPAMAMFSLRWATPCLIAWPAVADGVAQGTAPNRVFSVRPAATGATWLLMVVAVIVWNPGIVIFAYRSITVHKYGICKDVGGINFAEFWGQVRLGAGRQGQSSTMRGGGRRHRVGGKGVPLRGSVSNLGGAIFSSFRRKPESI